MSGPNKKEKYIIHDLRNRIFQAKSCLDIATELNPELAENVWLERSNAASLRAHQLLNELLSSRNFINKQAPDSDKAIWNLAEYIETRAKPDFESLQKQYSIAIDVQCHFSDETKYVSLNDLTIKRIKDNVVDNAINAGSTKLVVEYLMKDSYYSVSFSDNGKGMSSEQLDNLLLKQYQKGDIHGLGSQFLTATAKEHNFVLTYHSTLNEGTTVRFLCPYANITV